MNTAPDQSQPPTRRPISASRKLMSWVILVAAIGATAAFKYDQATRPTLLAGPMIQLVGPDQVIIQWSATSPFDRATVEVRAAGASVPDLHNLNAVERHYQLRLDHLPANTKIQYTIHLRGLLSQHALTSGPHTFRTPPGRDANIRFLAFGDSGVGSNTQALLAERMRACGPELIIHTGDLIYPTGAREDYAPNFYDPYRSLLTTSFFLPCLGNHDVVTEQGQPMLDEFTLPANGPAGIQSERNYYFDYGPARFVALDTNLKEPDGAITHDEMKTSIAKWLRTVLTDCDAKWKFVYFHHPFYTNSAHSADGSAHVKDAFVDVIESCEVDIVFNGHNHLYERTAPLLRDEIIDEAEIGLSNLALQGSALHGRDPARDGIASQQKIALSPLPNKTHPAVSNDASNLERTRLDTTRIAPADGRHGVVYIVTGAGGAYRYPENPEQLDYIRTYNDAVFSFTDIELRPNVCWVRQIDERGQAIDRFVIRKGPDTVVGSN